jgi:hypothetical protein
MSSRIAFTSEIFIQSLVNAERTFEGMGQDVLQIERLIVCTYHQSLVVGMFINFFVKVDGDPDSSLAGF